MILHTSRIFLAKLSVSLLALTACSTTSTTNRTDSAGASRVDTILERAARDAKAGGNKAEALAILEQLHAKNPKDASVATAFGQSLREDEQLNRARQVLVPFTEGKDAYADAITELAMVQLALGQYKESELTARRAVAKDPESGRAFLALGTALDAQNYHEQAEVAFRRGIDKWQGDPAPIMNNLALNLASQNKLDQAIDMLKRAKEVSPGRIEIERNIRIITTLQESADDFIIKQDAERKAASAPKKAVTPVTAKTTSSVTVKTTPSGEKTITKKFVEVKPAPKNVAKPVAKTAKPEKVEPAASNSTNARGSKQGFNNKPSVGNE